MRRASLEKPWSDVDDVSSTNDEKTKSDEKTKPGKQTEKKSDEELKHEKSEKSTPINPRESKSPGLTSVFSAKRTALAWKTKVNDRFDQETKACFQDNFSHRPYTYGHQEVQDIGHFACVIIFFCVSQSFV